MANIKVTLLDHMGSDLTVVNAARVSFDKESEWDDWVCPCGGTAKTGCGGNGTSCSFRYPELSDRDTKLIQFLARGMTAKDFDEFVEEVANMGYCCLTGDYEPHAEKLIKLLERYRDTPEHWSPFAHPQASFRVAAPIFVARQLQKHTVGLAWNEISRRYVDAPPTFYTPDRWRKRAENVKQGSSEEDITILRTRIYGDQTVADAVGRLTDHAGDLYKEMIEVGVCPEQARMVLPQSMMTEWIWTGSLYAFARVCKLRLDSHTQKETQQVAKLISAEMANLFPVSWQALVADKALVPNG